MLFGSGVDINFGLQHHRMCKMAHRFQLPSYKTLLRHENLRFIAVTAGPVGY